ncbi:G0/G1 switch protein 2 isoform X1 [Electrophorus electricus]|uniref:G0/G1 switch 2 n=1 Tax=Electrophorus electricus TaxID=8005 RepID=A0A4W4DWM8_ELEEL|nr:G0/G1 switch protein 2 isoform X1 [Electrophorus electricus]
MYQTVEKRSNFSLPLNKMETIQEIMPFAWEMLSAGPSKGSMKVYLVGGTFAFLGIVSGMAEAACSLFSEQEEPFLEEVMKVPLTVKDQAAEPQTAIPEPDDMEADTEAKAKEMPVLRQRRMSFRAHAS